MKRKLLGGGKKQLFTKRFFPAGNYTWVVPPGCTEVDVFIVGAGGGSHNNTFGGGGGCTKTFKKDTAGWRDGEAIAVAAGESISIVVGKGNPGSNGSYSEFLGSNYRAVGGQVGSSSPYRGGHGGSGGGGRYPGGSDGSNGGGDSPGSGQAHTTRDFGEPTGKRNAGGGSSASNSGVNPAGISDYLEGKGEDGTGTSSGYTAGKGGGGYGGGAGAPISNILTKGGDGTVLIRYWAYTE